MSDEIEFAKSMASTHPKLSLEFLGDASLIKAGTNKKLHWKCRKCDHEWVATLVKGPLKARSNNKTIRMGIRLNR